jgi:hypothetical protein
VAVSVSANFIRHSSYSHNRTVGIISLHGDRITLQSVIARDDSVLYTERFIKHTRIMKDKPLSLALNNQMSHLGTRVIDLAKENAVLISFAPHTSLELQPLDRSVYGPYRNFVNSSSDAWIRSNPAKTRTMNDIPFIVCQ